MRFEPKSAFGIVSAPEKARRRSPVWPMRAAVTVAVALGLLVLGGAIWLGPLGGLQDLRLWAAEGQRAAQGMLAGGLRGLRAGTPGALWSLCAVAFTYGVFHAAGPGHGKVILGGYGLGRRVALRRLAVLSVAASIAQALSAVVLVLTAVTVLSWGRGEVTHLTEDWLAPVSYALMGAVGLYLAGRGLWRLLRWPRVAAARSKSQKPLESTAPGVDLPPETAVASATASAGFAMSARHHLQTGEGWNPDRLPVQAEGICPDCGHRHGPSLDEVARLTSLREALMLIGVIAIRPCTGAIFLLLLTWRMGVFHAGVLGALAMGLGTALVTMAVAFGAAGLRQGTLWAALAGAASGAATARQARGFAAVLEILAGTLVALLCFGLLWPALA